MPASLQQLSQKAGKFDWGRSTPLEDISGHVAIVGVGETEYTGVSRRDCKTMALHAIAAAIEDAGLTPDQVDGLLVSFIDGQPDAKDFHEFFGTSHALWVSQEGGAMTWAATCAHAAAGALKRGDAKHIVNVFAVDWASQRAAGNSDIGGYHASEDAKQAFELAFGWYPQPLYFSTFTRRHMHEFGTTEQQLGELATTFRRHANGHPGAVMHQKTMTVQEYLQRPLLADPFRVEDCCLISDGAAAFVMTTPERAKDLKQKPIVVKGVGHGQIDGAPYISQQKHLTATPQTFAAPWAFAMADLAPKDVDVIGVYDCFSGTALMQIEDMGFCEKGEGGTFVENDRLHYQRPRAKGGIPCNTHGGLMSHAYVLGIAHVVELVRQLRGEAHNQVTDARVAAYAGFTAAEGATLILARD